VDTTQITLRDYRSGDVDAMYALDIVCFESRFRFSRTDMRRFAEARKARVAIAEVDGTMVGFCIVHVHRGGVGYVVTLDVAEQYRRHGVARMLMTQLEQTSGCTVMMLDVFVDNHTAVHFYKSMGYERIGIEEGYYGPGADAAVYRKMLQA
jgi:[ribosomal protein S18]-alanine N-acetyltransferase